ncbi:NAD(P)/FAD-dependent oxidoreductase [Chloroflexota bacterium]
MRIAIVGAGPAGCHLAHRLGAGDGGTGDADHEILLFDPRAPYEKPCGGGLGPLINRHLPDVMILPFSRHCPTRLVLRASDGSQVEQTLDPPPWAIVSREDLGRALLDRALANGHVRLVRQRVVDLEQTGGGWCLRTTSGQVFSADFLVGADGVRSVVRRRRVGPIPRQHLGLAMGYLVQGMPDALIFQTFSDLEGFLWSFPRPGHASVGIGSRLGAAPPRDLWQRLDRFLDDMCPVASRDRRWAALLPMAGNPTLWDTPCAGPGWALLGDAAGHVHPITGEGIAYALWSAELLAEAFGQGDPQVYEGLWRERYGNGFMVASSMLRPVDVDIGAYEIVFQVATARALSVPNKAD